MSKKSNAAIAVAVSVLLLVAASVGIGFALSRYVIVGFRFYPRDQYVLDLRGQNISAKTFQKLDRELPTSWIIWDVPFQDTTYSSDAMEITVTSLREEDVYQLDYLPNLKTVHAEDCTDYDALMLLAQRREHCQVLYNVTIGGSEFSSDAEFLQVPNLTAEDVPKLAYLPKLSRLDATGCMEYPVLMQLEQAHPEWDVVYAITVSGKSYQRDTTEITAFASEYLELSKAFQVLPELKTVTLKEPKATGKELQKLRQEFPNVDIHWELTINKELRKDDLTDLDITGLALKDVREGELLADYFPNLERIDMSNCGIDNETMAAFREEKRGEYKVVWTVRLTAKCV